MFEFSPDARFEFLHPADAGTAFARAVACDEAIGKTLFVSRRREMPARRTTNSPTR